MISPELFGYLIPSVVLAPMLAAALCLVVSRRPRVQNVITIATLTGVLVISGILLVLTEQHGMHTVQVGGWDAPVGITLVADRLSALMLCVSAVILLTVLKVFLIDMSALTGALRAFSFIGLGLALIAIGRFYQRILRRGSSRGEPPAGHAPAPDEARPGDG